jgi:pantoate kinase
MAANNVHVSEELLAELQSKAAAEGKSPDEIVEIALERFLMHRRLEELVRYGKPQAERLGLTEGDVPRLIEEHRSEQSRR